MIALWSLRSLRSLRRKSLAIAVIIVIIWKPLSSDRSDNNRWDSGFHIIAATAKLFLLKTSSGNHSPAIAATTIAEIELFLSPRSPIDHISAITSIVAIIWKPGFRENLARVRLQLHSPEIQETVSRNLSKFRQWKLPRNCVKYKNNPSKRCRKV